MNATSMLTINTTPACAHRFNDLDGFCADRETPGFWGLQCAGRRTLSDRCPVVIIRACIKVEFQPITPSHGGTDRFEVYAFGWTRDTSE